MIKRLRELLKELLKKEERIPLRNKTYVHSKFGGWDILVEKVK